MATYTDNYQFTKPTYAEVADVQTFNNNMTKIDEILHASQVSLAPAYDPTETYNAGDVVMYELLMYECQEDGVTGVWDPTKWRRTTAGEHGGGSDVEPNPTGEPTATLNKLGIEGTIYGIEGSGGNVYGAFIDTNRVIQSRVQVNAGDTGTYTATEDCIVVAEYYGGTNGGDIKVDGVTVSQIYSPSNASVNNVVCIPLKRGRVFSIKSIQYPGTFTVYGLTFGTQNIFTPQIYSTEERCVGVWIDNKPLYQKSYRVQSLPNASAVEYSLGISDIDSVAFLGCIVENSSVALPLFYNAGNDNGSKIQIHLSDKATGKVIINTFNDNRSSMSGTVVIQYTKTTDTAGSGSYNSLGVPMVHESTIEQVIGTDEYGNTKYEITLTTPTSQSGNSYFFDLTGIDNVEIVGGYIDIGTADIPLNFNIGSFNNSTYTFYDKQNSRVISYIVGWTPSYFKIKIQYTKSSS